MTVDEQGAVHKMDDTDSVGVQEALTGMKQENGELKQQVQETNRLLADMVSVSNPSSSHVPKSLGLVEVADLQPAALTPDQQHTITCIAQEAMTKSQFDKKAEE